MLSFVLHSAEFSQPGRALRWRAGMQAQLTFSPPSSLQGVQGLVASLPEWQEKQAGPQHWSCGNLNIATLHLPPNGLCLEMGNLLFRNLSACGKGLCFKVFLSFKGVSFNFISDRSVSYTKVQETPGLHRAAEGKPGQATEKGLGAVQRTSWQEGNPDRVFMFMLFSCCTPVISFPPALHFLLSTMFPPPGIHKIFRSPSSQK